MINTEDLVTTAVAADLLEVSVPTVNRWVRENLIRPAAQGAGTRGPRFFRLADIEAFAAERESGAA